MEWLVRRTRRSLDLYPVRRRAIFPDIPAPITKELASKYARHVLIEEVSHARSF